MLQFVDTPLHIAVSIGHIPFATEMMGLKPSFAWKLNPDGFSPIHLVLQNRHIELVRWLLLFDGDLACVKGRERLTPLHYVVATSDHHLDLLEEFLLVCPNSIADVTVQNETALHIALKYDKLNTFMFFVGWLGRNLSKNAEFYERGVLNWEDDHGYESLLLAWGSEFVSINHTNLEGKTAWDILQGQTQVDNRKIKVMLHRAKAKSDSSLSTKIALLVTISYQVVLNPPWGLWQDDRKYNATEIGNTTNSGTNDQTQCNTTVAHTVGTPIASKEYGFFLFMVFSVGLMMQQLLQLRDEVLLHAAVLYVVFSFVLDFKIEHPVLGSS
nr:ankyrin repeat-containing protein BDA1-like [Quercus suber]